MIDARLACGAVARAEFVGACEATAQAWYGTNLLAMARRQHVVRAREVLQAGDVAAIVEMMQDIGGPVAPANPREALGHNAHQHKAAAGLLASLAVRRAVLAGGLVHDQVERMKDDLASWVEQGSFVAASAGADRSAAQAEAIAELIAVTAHADGVRGDDIARLRLAVVAPLAPPLESLRVIARLDEGFVRDAPNGARPMSGDRGASAADGAGISDDTPEPMDAGDVDQCVSDAVARRASLRDRLAGVVGMLGRWRSRQK